MWTVIISLVILFIRLNWFTVLGHRPTMQQCRMQYCVAGLKIFTRNMQLKKTNLDRLCNIKLLYIKLVMLCNIVACPCTSSLFHYMIILYFTMYVYGLAINFELEVKYRKIFLSQQHYRKLISYLIYSNSECYNLATFTLFEE